MGPRLLREGTRKGLLLIAIFWASRLELINLRKAPVCGRLLRCDQADHRRLSTQKKPPGRRCNGGARWRGCLYWKEALRGLCEGTHCLLLGLDCGRCLWMAAPFVRGSSKLGLVWPQSPLPAYAQLRSKCRDGGTLFQSHLLSFLLGPPPLLRNGTLALSCQSARFGRSTTKCSAF